MPLKKDATTGDETVDEKPTEPANPQVEMLTLELKSNAFWRGEFCPGGTRMTFPRAEGLALLATTDLWKTV